VTPCVQVAVPGPVVGAGLLLFTKPQAGARPLTFSKPSDRVVSPAAFAGAEIAKARAHKARVADKDLFMGFLF
jgi:hypothetical protein